MPDPKPLDPPLWLALLMAPVAVLVAVLCGLFLAVQGVWIVLCWGWGRWWK